MRAICLGLLLLASTPYLRAQSDLTTRFASLAPVQAVVTTLSADGRPVLGILHGGNLDAQGHLRGAAVALASPTGTVLWDGFDRGLHPWHLCAGRFAGENMLLVGVRKTAPFDPREAPRPFLYSVRPGGAGLSKVWLGTSLARPLFALDLADLDARGEDELVALEYGPTGRLSVAAYRWRGFGVEGIARSEEIDGARELACEDVWSGPGKEAVVRIAAGTRYTFLAYQLQGEELTMVGRVGVTVGEGPVQWRLVARSEAGPGGVLMQRGAVQRLIQFASPS
jgi:hypothetical protein